jgi:ABC-2 type transport system permease protein
MLFCQAQCATAVLSLLQAAAFVVVALLLGTELPVWGWTRAARAAGRGGRALMLGALGLLLSVHIKQLENFAGTMNFVIFPMYFMSTALYPLWKLEESGAPGCTSWRASTPSRTRWSGCALRSTARTPACRRGSCSGTLALCFGLACWGYDPQRGFGG